jgi:hypothetical protein
MTVLEPCLYRSISLIVQNEICSTIHALEVIRFKAPLIKIEKISCFGVALVTPQRKDACGKRRLSV